MFFCTELVRMAIGTATMESPHLTIEPNITSTNYNHSPFTRFVWLQSMQLALVNQAKNPIIRSHWEKVIPLLFNTVFISLINHCLTVPDGMPIGFRAVNKTSSSISLEWHPPPRNTIHGEFLGYYLGYRKNTNNALLQEREIAINDPEVKVRFLFCFANWEWVKEKKTVNDSVLNAYTDLKMAPSFVWNRSGIRHA